MKQCFLLVWLGVALACQNATAQLVQIVQPALRPKISTGVHRGGFFTDATLCFRWFSTTKGVKLQGFARESLLIGAGIETNYKFRRDFRLTPKIVLEYNPKNTSFMLRLQNRFYPAKDLNYRCLSWQACPEVGLNLFHALTIGYGYSFAITGIKCTPSLGHQLCLSYTHLLND